MKKQRIKLFSLLACALSFFLAGCPVGFSDVFHWTFVPPEARQIFQDKFACTGDTYCGTVELVLSTDPAAVAGYIPMRFTTTDGDYLVIIDANSKWVLIRLQDEIEPVTGYHLGLIENLADVVFWNAQDIRITYLPSDFDATRRMRCKASMPATWDQLYPAGVWTATGIKLNALCEFPPP